jgi:hypothetical protein
LKDSVKDWQQEWFIIGNHPPALPPRTGHAPVPADSWKEGPKAEAREQVEELMGMIAVLRNQRLTGPAIMLDFCKKLIQPIKNRIHPVYEYTGLENPTRAATRVVPEDEYWGRVESLVKEVEVNLSQPRSFTMDLPAPEVIPVCFALFC